MCTDVVQPLEVIGRQEMPQQAPVEINLSEMSPFISDVSQGQLQPQVRQSKCSLIQGLYRAWKDLEFKSHIFHAWKVMEM